MLQRVVLFLLTFILSSQFVNAQVYQGQSFDEIMRPMLEYRNYYNWTVSQLETLLSKTEEVGGHIDRNKDPRTWSFYSDFHDEIANVLKNVGEHGASMDSRNAISRFKQNYSAVIGRIVNAYNRRVEMAKDQYNRLQSVPNLKCDRFYIDMSLDDFLDGNTPDVNYHY